MDDPLPLQVLETLHLCLQFCRVAEDAPVGKFLSPQVFQSLLEIVQAKDELVVRKSWELLIDMTQTPDGPAALIAGGFLGRFCSLVCSFISDCVAKERFDFQGLPFSSLFSVNSDEMQTALSSKVVALLTELDRGGERSRRKLTKALGKPFLATFLRDAKMGYMPLTDFKIDPKQVELGKVLGQGAAGTVFQGRWHGEDVAVKKINEDSLGFSVEEFMSELALMNIIRHPNVAHLLGGCMEQGSYFLLSHCFALGSLSAIIRNKEIPLEKPRVLSIALQTAKGMKYLHEIGLIHRDLKPGNILVDTDWKVAVCDFGVSRMVDTLNMTRGVGTPLFMAPEVLQGTSYTEKADVYSFSICLWMLEERLEPFEGEQVISFIPRIIEDNLRPPVNPNHIFSMLSRDCWEGAPEERPSFRQIVARIKAIAADGKPELLPRKSGGPARRGSAQFYKENPLRKSQSGPFHEVPVSRRPPPPRKSRRWKGKVQARPTIPKKKPPTLE